MRVCRSRVANVSCQSGYWPPKCHHPSPSPLGQASLQRVRARPIGIRIPGVGICGEGGSRAGRAKGSRGVRVRQGRPGAGPGRLYHRLRWLAQAAVGRCPCRSQQQRQCSCSDTARRVGRLADPGKSGSGVRPRRAVLRPGLVRSLACPQVGLTPEHFLFGPQRQRQAAVGARRGSGSTSCPWRRQRYSFTGRWL